MGKTVETRAYDSTFDDTGDGMTISGYASVFNRRSVYLGFIEIIEKGSFDGCDMFDVIATCEHNMHKPLARTTNQTLTLTVDNTGLHYEAKMADVSYARDLAVLLKTKLINKSSFGFTIDKEEWDYEGDIPVRRILKFAWLRDVGPVINPAYQDTTASVRSMIPEKPTLYTGRSLVMAKQKFTLHSKLITAL